MIRTIAWRLFLTSVFAFIGMFAGLGATPVFEPLLPNSCAMGDMAFGMLAGAILGSLVGCAVAVPCQGVALRWRILSFVLSPVMAIVGLYAIGLLYIFFAGDGEPSHGLALLLTVLALALPAFSLLGFSLPLLVIGPQGTSGPKSGGGIPDR